MRSQRLVGFIARGNMPIYAGGGQSFVYSRGVKLHSSRAANRSCFQDFLSIPQAECISMDDRPKPAEATTYQRIVQKNFSEYHYLKTQLVFQDKTPKISAAQFKSLILSALKDLHGEVGVSFPLDLLKFDEKTLCAILRIKSSGLVKLWTSLTLLGQYQGLQCSVRVLQTSPFLLALAGNSRELVLD